MKAPSYALPAHYRYKQKWFGIIKLDPLFSSLHVNKALSLFRCKQPFIEIAQLSN
jgi:hypothetical protein